MAMRRRGGGVEGDIDADEKAAKEADVESSSVTPTIQARTSSPSSLTTKETIGAPETDPATDDLNDEGEFDLGFSPEDMRRTLGTMTGESSDVPDAPEVPTDDAKLGDVAASVVPNEAPGTSEDVSPDVPPVSNDQVEVPDIAPSVDADPAVAAPQVNYDVSADDVDDEFEQHWKEHMQARYNTPASVGSDTFSKLGKLFKFLNPLSSNKETYATPTEDQGNERKSFPMLTLGRMVGQSALAAAMVIAVMPGVSFDDISDSVQNRLQDAAQYSIQLADDTLDEMTGLKAHMQNNFDDLRNDIASGIATTEYACNANQIALDVEEGMDAEGNPAAVAGISPEQRPGDENRMSSIPSR